MTEPRDPHHYSRTIAARIKSMRRERGWSAERFAKEMTALGFGWNRGVVTKAENGRRESLTVDEAMAIVDLFGLSVDGLLTSPCHVCAGAPPAGFTCNECGRKGTP